LGFGSDALRSYQLGRGQDQWARTPVAPAVPNDPQGLGGIVCGACRVGDKLGVSLIDADSTPGHAFANWADPGSTAGLSLYQGGTLVGKADGLAAAFTVPAAPAAYRLVADETRNAPGVTLGTASHTEWTFASAEPAGNGVPANWICPDTGAC